MQNLVLLCATVGAYCLSISEILDYPLFDVVSCATKGIQLLFIAPFYFRRIVESMVNILFRSSYCRVDYLWPTP